MKNLSIFCLLIVLSGCVKFASKEEVLYRSNIENSIVKVFPEKVIVVIHPFKQKSKGKSQLSYLENAIPDSLESMLESLRTTLAYVPFNGMPFYVSKEFAEQIMELKSSLEKENHKTNSSSDDFLNSSSLSSGTSNLDAPSIDWSSSSISTNNSSNVFDTSVNDEPKALPKSHYFAYYTNFLIPIATEKEELTYDITTNTNYYDILTNIYFENGISITNVISNQIIDATTNNVTTNMIITNDFLMTSTNMLLLIQEEYPELIEYLSFLPIEVRRSSEQDEANLADFRQSLINPKKWAKERKEKLIEKELEELEKKELENEENSYELEEKNGNLEKVADPRFPQPTDRFSYVYHITGTYETLNQKNQIISKSIETEIQIKIYPPQSTGDLWWQDTFEESPPKINKILTFLNRFSDKHTKDKDYATAGIRNPYKRPKMFRRMQDELRDTSSHYHDENLKIPKEEALLLSEPKTIILRTDENRIPIKLQETLKEFHSIIINRPYAPLKITSFPEKTLVYLNGFFIGKTPLLYPTAPIGQQRISFIKEGFNREEILLDIEKDRTNEVEYKLAAVAKSGSIEINASKTAEVYINTRYQGLTPITVSDLSLNTEHRIEILDPSTKAPNRSAVYKTIILTEKSPRFTFDAQFKSFNTNYQTPAQKALLSATYLSWFSTIAILGGCIYAQTQTKEFAALANSSGVTNQVKKDEYGQKASYFATIAETSLYVTIAGVIASCGIMGWYLHSKNIYLGINSSSNKKEWYAKLGAKF